MLVDGKQEEEREFEDVMYVLVSPKFYTSTLLSKKQAKAVRNFIWEVFGTDEPIKIRAVGLDFDISALRESDYSALVTNIL